MNKIRSWHILLISILCFAGGVIADRIGQRYSVELEIAKIASNVANALDVATELIARTPAGVSSDNDYPYLVFEGDSLIKWSDHRFVPPIGELLQPFDVKTLVEGGDVYLLKKSLVNNQVIIVIIPLIKRYPIINEYLAPEYNSKILKSANVRIFDPASASGYEVCHNNECFFRISFLGQPGDETTLPPILFFLALFFFVLFCFAVVRNVAKSVSAEAGFLFLLIAFAAVRGAMTAIGFPGNYLTSGLFAPQVFAVSVINASLGDLFINMIFVLLLSIYIFRNYSDFHFQRLKHQHRLAGLVAGFVAALLILYAAVFPVIVIQTLYNNSSIVIDISQTLQFDQQRIIAIIIVLMSGVSSFLFIHAALRTLASLRESKILLTCALTSLFVFIVINESIGQQYFWSTVLVTVYSIIVATRSLFKKLQRLSFGTFAYLFIAIVFLSGVAAITVQHFTEKEKIENQFRFASNFLIDRDIFAEYLLDEAASRIASDAFIQTRINNPFLGKEPVRQKIRQVFLPSYFNKYDVNILIFNAQGDPIENNTNESFATIVRRYDHDAFRTKFEGVRFIDNPDAEVAQRYLVIIPMSRSGLISAHVIIELSLKKIIPENVYPELLVDHSFQTFYRTEELSYAAFADGRTVYTSGEFNYEHFFDKEKLGNPSLYTTGIKALGYDHIGVEDENGRVIVVSSKIVKLTDRLANFSFFLLLGLLIILFMIFLQGIYQYVRGSRLFFSARIQLYLNLAFFIPLLIVCVSTLRLTSQSSLQQLNAEYLNKAKTFGQQIIPRLENRDEEEAGDMRTQVADVAKLLNLDANLYSTAGTLLASSQPLIFENNLLSGYINPKALDRIRQGENLLIESESIGKLQYYVSYAALRSSQTRQLLAVVGIPFFHSAHVLEKMQTVILVNILNIFAVIFIILLFLSYVVAERLTFPLRFITHSLKSTTFTEQNKPLTWATQDEIGFMVKEYNAMLYKLSESKNQLEQTQREKAWREIAQQVAHEIKNPLTPMKLTLQQLERTLQNGSQNPDKTANAVKMLLGQIETLNDIASSFSGFVKMPDLVIEKTDLIQIVKRSIDLHSQAGDIRLKTTLKEAWVDADTQLLSRTISNLIINGMQAAVPGRNSIIDIGITSHGGNRFLVAIKDNGKGISAAIIDRVFLPHFSTKKTGSGLGLAIAKQGIEQMKGKIWFETIEGLGTTFFIELPAA